ncbi:hypothetical protein ASG35_23530 [Burkholderia sp. Leaf177]|nr:hypothetical protein ASG35_23530 [Burkholderia sp. Leaf177]
MRLVHLRNLPKFRLAGRRVLPSSHTAAFAAWLLKSMVDPLMQRPDVPTAEFRIHESVLAKEFVCELVGD